MSRRLVLASQNRWHNGVDYAIQTHSQLNYLITTSMATYEPAPCMVQKPNIKAGLLKVQAVLPRITGPILSLQRLQTTKLAPYI